jgi:putative membrane protein
MRMLLHWLVTALGLLLIAHLVPGFEVRYFTTALIAAIVIGLINATLGLLLKIITFPITLVTFGIFLLVINALMLELAANLVPGFTIVGFWPALEGAILLALINVLWRWATKRERE